MSVTLNGRQASMRAAMIHAAGPAGPSTLFMVTGETSVSLLEFDCEPDAEACAGAIECASSGPARWSAPVLEQVVERVAQMVGGCEGAVRGLVEALSWSLFNAQHFKSYGLSPPAGVLLFGPPGTGKTLLARCVCVCVLV